MAKLIFEQAIHTNPVTGEVESYWPERWPLHLLGKELESNGTAFFTVSYQNDPSALEGNCLKRDWIHFYLPADLEAARNAENTKKGARYAAIDPTRGGDESADLDFCGGVVAERLGNRAFLVAKLNRRLKIEDQAQTFEDWLQIYDPDFVAIEDVSSRGYVYTEMSSTVNAGQGSRFTFEIVKPQSKAAGGDKQMRFLSMSPRFENSQVLVPGYREEGSGEITVHPDWDDFLSQWTSFPSGHDDLLDATYWALYLAFKFTPAASSGKDKLGQVPLNSEEIAVKILHAITPKDRVEAALYKLDHLQLISCTAVDYWGGIRAALMARVGELIEESTPASLKLAASHTAEIRRLDDANQLQERQYTLAGQPAKRIGEPIADANRRTRLTGRRQPIAARRSRLTQHGRPSYYNALDDDPRFQ